VHEQQVDGSVLIEGGNMERGIQGVRRLVFYLLDRLLHPRKRLHVAEPPLVHHLENLYNCEREKERESIVRGRRDSDARAGDHVCPSSRLSDVREANSAQQGEEHVHNP
jgi:hypothetical protein